ncbi:MAG: O-antigen polysaccharide polymerase Wzy family protein [Bacilli bacterium]|nr:O-antigen polysaccharide polymerase Wzy family protein [Bacilli bacterium]
MKKRLINNYALSLSSIVLVLFLNLISTLFYKIETIKEGYAIFFYISVAVFAFIVFSARAVNGRFTVYHMLIVGCFLFYFGGQALVAFGYFDKLSEDRVFSIVDGRIPLEACITSMILILSILLMINAGYCLFSKTIPFSSNKQQKSNTALLRCGLVIFWITLIPTMMSLSRSAFLNFTLGHLGYRSEKIEETGIWFVCSYLMGWFRPACYMVLIASKGKKKASMVGYTGILLYCILYLLSGSRYQLIEVAFCIFSIRYLWGNKKLKKQTILKLIAILFAFGVALKAIGYFRNDASSTSFSEALVEVFSDNIFYQLLSTTSTTFTTISNVVFRCPQDIPFNFGKGYLGSLLFVLPSFARPADMTMLNIDVETIFSPLYYNWTVSGYGSSFVAEMFFNFGYYSLAVSFILGVFIAVISERFYKASSNSDHFSFFFYMYLFSELLWAIRSDTYLIPRHVLLYCLLPYIFYLLFKNAMNKDKSIYYSTVLREETL